MLQYAALCAYQVSRTHVPQSKQQRQWYGGALHAASRMWHTAGAAAPLLRAAGGAPCAGAGARGRAAVAAGAAACGPAACAPVPSCQPSRRGCELGPTAGGASTYGCRTTVIFRVNAAGQGFWRKFGATLSFMLMLHMLAHQCLGTSCMAEPTIEYLQQVGVLLNACLKWRWTTVMQSWLH